MTAQIVACIAIWILMVPFWRFVFGLLDRIYETKDPSDWLMVWLWPITATVVVLVIAILAWIALISKGTDGFLREMFKDIGTANGEDAAHSAAPEVKS